MIVQRVIESPLLDSPSRVVSEDIRDLGFIPGYTGYCPGVRFEIGKTYGNSTRCCMLKKLTMKDESASPMLHAEYSRYNDLNRDLRFRHPSCDYGRRRGILGYTGYIPGLSFRYGQSYGQASDVCMDMLERQKREYQNKPRSKSVPMRFSGKEVDENDFHAHYSTPLASYTENLTHVPISGYTGHIPRLNSTSIGKTYTVAANNGFLQLKKESQWKKNVDEVNTILNKHR